MKETENYYLREVLESDMELLFQWANDPIVRASAINTGLISWEGHKQWFAKKIISPVYEMFILEVDHKPLGQIRFEYNDVDEAWEIGYSIAKQYRGSGYSKLLVSKGIHKLNKFPVVGYVRIDNIRSNNVFTALGFINEGVKEINDVKLIKYILKDSRDGANKNK